MNVNNNNAFESIGSQLHNYASQYKEEEGKTSGTLGSIGTVSKLSENKIGQHNNVINFIEQNQTKFNSSHLSDLQTISKAIDNKIEILDSEKTKKKEIFTKSSKPKSADELQALKTLKEKINQVTDHIQPKETPTQSTKLQKPNLQQMQFAKLGAEVAQRREQQMKGQPLFSRSSSPPSSPSDLSTSRSSSPQSPLTAKQLNISLEAIQAKDAELGKLLQNFQNNKILYIKTMTRVLANERASVEAPTEKDREKSKKNAEEFSKQADNYLKPLSEIEKKLQDYQVKDPDIQEYVQVAREDLSFLKKLVEEKNEEAITTEVIVRNSPEEIKKGITSEFTGVWSEYAVFRKPEAPEKLIQFHNGLIKRDPENAESYQELTLLFESLHESLKEASGVFKGEYARLDVESEGRSYAIREDAIRTDKHVQVLEALVSQLKELKTRAEKLKFESNNKNSLGQEGDFGTYSQKTFIATLNKLEKELNEWNSVPFEHVSEDLKAKASQGIEEQLKNIISNQRAVCDSLLRISFGRSGFHLKEQGDYMQLLKTNLQKSAMLNKFLNEQKGNLKLQASTIGEMLVEDSGYSFKQLRASLLNIVEDAYLSLQAKKMKGEPAGDEEKTYLEVMQMAKAFGNQLEEVFSKLKIYGFEKEIDLKSLKAAIQEEKDFNKKINAFEKNAELPYSIIVGLALVPKDKTAAKNVEDKLKEFSAKIKKSSNHPDYLAQIKLLFNELEACQSRAKTSTKNQNIVDTMKKSPFKKLLEEIKNSDAYKNAFPATKR